MLLSLVHVLWLGPVVYSGINPFIALLVSNIPGLVIATIGFVRSFLQKQP